MMTRDNIKRVAAEALMLVILSVALLLLGTWLSSFKKNDRLQFSYDGRFMNVLPADTYTEINSSLVDNSNEVSHVYEALTADGNTLGYIIDLEVFDDTGRSLHFLTGITYDGASLTGIRHIADEANPIPITEEEISILAASTVGRQIPVALQQNDQNVISEAISEPQRLSGLQDGVYYAQALEKDRNGYIDYVEMEISDGIIVRVQWDAMNVDRTTRNRREASLTGDYSTSGEPWANQSYNICRALMQLQNPGLLAMKSDGTTEIVEGVTVNIRPFVELAEECIANSRAGFDKDAYMAGLNMVLIDLFTSDAETLGILDATGHVVYSFDEYPNLFARLDEAGNAISYMNIREYVEEAGGFEGNGEGSYFPNPDSHDQQTPGIPDGSEDGVSPNGDNIITENVDGLPQSEIRNRIEGLPDNEEASSYYITAINTSYSFLKNYLNWVA
ncbi:MAG: hypothetical protein J5685_12740 [Clostridiales bacterium]|nr:hypothetical protein [Clostridiales bacterium]